MSQNRDIQASQHILRLLENAKHSADDVLDTLPGLFAVFNEDFRVLRSNVGLAELLGSDLESCLMHDIRTLIDPAHVQTFEDAVTSLPSCSPAAKVFETKINRDGEAPAYLLSLRLMRNIAGSHLVLMMGENVTDLKRVTAHKTRMEAELKTASEIQSRLLPTRSCEVGRLSICGSYTPATECGGDLWHYFKHKENFVCCIGDVTGHGVPAALTTSALRAGFSMLENQERFDVKLATEQLNQMIVDCTKGQHFVTLCLILIDPNSGDCTFVRAGHEHFFRIRPKATGTIPPGAREIEPVFGKNNNPVGLSAADSFDESTVKIQAGDRLFFYTDGVIQLLDDERHSGGLRRLQKILTSANAQTHGAIAFNDFVADALKPLMGKDPDLQDDVTFFTLAMS